MYKSVIAKDNMEPITLYIGRFSYPPVHVTNPPRVKMKFPIFTKENLNYYSKVFYEILNSF